MCKNKQKNQQSAYSHLTRDNEVEQVFTFDNKEKFLRIIFDKYNFFYVFLI